MSEEKKPTKEIRWSDGFRRPDAKDDHAGFRSPSPRGERPRTAPPEQRDDRGERRGEPPRYGDAHQRPREERGGRGGDPRHHRDRKSVV